MLNVLARHLKKFANWGLSDMAKTKAALDGALLEAIERGRLAKEFNLKPEQVDQYIMRITTLRKYGMNPDEIKALIHAEIKRDLEKSGVKIVSVARTDEGEKVLSIAPSKPATQNAESQNVPRFPQPRKESYYHPEYVDYFKIKSNPYRPDYLPLDDSKVDSIVGSINKNAFWMPLLVRRNGDHYELAYGHHRLAAFHKVYPDDRVPVIVRELTDDQIRETLAAEFNTVYGSKRHAADMLVLATMRHLGFEPPVSMVPKSLAAYVANKLGGGWKESAVMASVRRLWPWWIGIAPREAFQKLEPRVLAAVFRQTCKAAEELVEERFPLLDPESEAFLSDMAVLKSQAKDKARTVYDNLFREATSVGTLCEPECAKWRADLKPTPDGEVLPTTSIIHAAKSWHVGKAAARLTSLVKFAPSIDDDGKAALRLQIELEIGKLQDCLNTLNQPVLPGVH